MAGSLQGYALSLAGLRRQVDPHWKRGMSFLRLGLGALQMLASDATSGLMAWLPIPLRELEPCIPQPHGQATASTGLVLQRGAATEITITSSSASHPRLAVA
jgi:hypothetical protein